jgi:hypothetical protein
VVFNVQSPLLFTDISYSPFRTQFIRVRLKKKLLAIVDNIDSATAIQHCHFSTKTVMSNKERNECGYAPIKTLCMDGKI